MLVVRVLGGLALELDGGPLEPPARRHGQLLLGYLALNPGLHARSSLAALLWPDVLDSSARSSLRSALSSVRRTLGDDADAYLVATRDRIGLTDDGRVSVDVREFRALVDAGRLGEAARADSGPILQGLDVDWVEEARREHREQVEEVLASLAAAAESRGDLELAIRHTREQVALDPLAEAANRDLMRRLAAAGDRASALSIYARLAEAFRNRLGAAPSPQTRELAARVRAAADDPDAGGWPALPLPPALGVHVRRPIAGRGAELAELEAALAEAQAGGGRVAFVTGEPGIGKTGLMASFAADAASDTTVLFGRASASAVVPLAPLVEALRWYAASAPVERQLSELPAVAAQLVGLVPELAESSLAAAPGMTQIPLGEGGRLMRVVVETLLAICARRPLVLVVDDLQDADPETLRALSHLAAAAGSSRLLVVAAYRTPGAQRIEGTLRQLRRLPSVRWIVLGALRESEVGELAAAVAGHALARDLVRALHRHSGGNPLFAAELVRRARARSRDDDVTAAQLVDSPLPERVSDLILDELAELAPETHRMLSTAAALGDEFDLPTLASVMDAGTERCLDALDEAVAGKAIQELPHGVGRFQFRHPLIRETLYARLTATRRAHLHLRIADALEPAAAADDGGRARAIAEHLARARELAPRERVVEWTVRAADAAAALLAHEDAARLYGRAARLAAADVRERSRLLLRHAGSSRRAGLIAEAREAYAEASRLAGELGDAALLAEAALGIGAAPDFTAPQAVDELAVELVTRALDAIPPGELSARARLLAQLAAARYFGGDPAELAGLVAEAGDLARRSGDPAAVAAALDTAHTLRRGSGDPRERLALATELLERARASGDPERLALAHVRRTGDLFELGDFDGVRREREELTRVALELRQPAYLWWTKLWQATEAIFLGADDGEQLAIEAYEAGRTAFGDAAELERGAQLFWLALEAGTVADRDPSVDRALGGYTALPAVRCALARIDAEEGRTTAAAEALERLTGAELETLRREAGWPLCATLLAETCARVGDAEAAGRLRAAIEPRAGWWATSTFGSVCLGPLSGSLALVCAVAGSGSDASRYHDDALESCATAGAGPAAARLERELDRLRARAASR